MSAGRRRAAYVNTGTFATPVWVHISRISDVQRPKSRGTSERKYRGAKNVKTVTGYIKYGWTFKYHIKGPNASADAVLVKLQDSMDSEIVLDVLFLNQRISQPTGTFPGGANAVGVRAPVVVTKLDESESDEEGCTYDVELMEVEDEQSSVLNETMPFTTAVVAV
ncbi:MAG: hypothetical protein ABL921_21390 [Pirellula sp.]